MSAASGIRWLNFNFMIIYPALKQAGVQNEFVIKILVSAKAGFTHRPKRVTATAKKALFISIATTIPLHFLVNSTLYARAKDVGPKLYSVFELLSSVLIT